LRQYRFSTLLFCLGKAKLILGSSLTKLVATGGACTVECVIRRSGECPTETFLLNDLAFVREKGKADPQSTATARFMQLFQQMADCGNVSNKRFKKEMGKLYAFRHEVSNQQIRFPCFQDGNKWILTHGFIKPGAQKGKGAWPPSEVTRANAIMEEYFAHKAELENAKKGGK
jgi:hypothetical protein